MNLDLMIALVVLVAEFAVTEATMISDTPLKRLPTPHRQDRFASEE